MERADTDLGGVAMFETVNPKLQSDSFYISDDASGPFVTSYDFFPCSSYTWTTLLCLQ